MSDDAAILLFIKAPRKGRVKTRLAASLGNDAALELYVSFVADIIDAIDKTGYPLRICFHPPEAQEAVALWLGQDRRYLAQKGYDLGERMENALQQVFAEGYVRTVLVGSDIPDLTTEMLREAVAALRTKDSVIGPAHDGGYYLIGFRKEAFLPAIFQAMAWSTGAVFKTTIERLHTSGRSIHRLPQMRDIDGIEDLLDLRKRISPELGLASRTLKAMTSLLPR